MRRAQTALSPDAPTTALVNRGPLRYSRDPIYVSFSLIYAGVATFVNALWPLVFLPGVLLIPKQMVDREEPYLERVIGAAYLRHKHQVRCRI